MPMYRKKPVVIEAFCFMGGFSFDEMLVEWGKPFADVATLDYANQLHIRTLESHKAPLTATMGDFIIRGVAGEFYPCRPDIFAATYEPVGEVVHA
jgi:hypothetical protein